MLLILVIFLITAAQVLLLAPILYHAVGRRLINQFPNCSTLFPRIPGYNQYACSVTFATCIVFRRRSISNKAIYGVTEGYNFKKNSTQTEKIVSMYYLANGFTMVAAMVAFFVATELFDIEV